jgi:hypothetical protein
LEVVDDEGVTLKKYWLPKIPASGLKIPHGGEILRKGGKLVIFERVEAAASEEEEPAEDGGKQGVLLVWRPFLNVSEEC